MISHSFVTGPKSRGVYPVLMVGTGWSFPRFHLDLMHIIFSLRQGPISSSSCSWCYCKTELHGVFDLEVIRTLSLR